MAKNMYDVTHAPQVEENDALREYIEELTSEYIRFRFPSNIDIKYSYEAIRKHFKRFDWEREYYETSRDGMMMDDIVTTGYTVTCWFKDKVTDKDLLEE